MSKFEDHYEKYRHTLLNDRKFLERFQDIYDGTFYVVRDLIDRNGVLTKVGILSAISAFFAASYLQIGEQHSLSGRIALIACLVISIICLILAILSGKKFKHSLAKREFEVYERNKLILDRVCHDHCSEADELMHDMVQKFDIILRSTESLISKEVSKEEIDNLFFMVAKASNEYRDRYEEVSHYHRFKRQLSEDYDFNLEIDKHIAR